MQSSALSQVITREADDTQLLFWVNLAEDFIKP
jgi:hypothetical protein